MKIRKNKKQLKSLSIGTFVRYKGICYELIATIKRYGNRGNCVWLETDRHIDSVKKPSYRLLEIHENLSVTVDQ